MSAVRALSLLLVLAAAQSEAQSPASGYLAALDAYTTRHTSRAVEALLALGPEGLKQAKVGVAAVARDRLAVDVRAAAMLHTDVVDALWSADRKRALAHMDAARAWADVSEKVASPFRRRWYLAMGLLLVERGTLEGGLEPAFTHLEHACEVFPDDAPILTATAWLEERSALAPAVWNARRDPQALGPRRAKGLYLHRAVDRLSAAIQIDPAALEPALRLGRLRMLLGDRTEARKLLEPVLARRDLADRDAYMARLFLARAAEDDGDSARATELYRDAVARIPSAASARLGLARLLHMSGKAGAAGEMLAPSLGRSGGAPDEDPWFDYLVGHVRRGSRLREILRGEVQQ